MNDEPLPERRLVGRVAVDSGTVVIADPCYVMTDERMDQVFDADLRYKAVSGPWPSSEDRAMGRGMGAFDPQEVEPGFVVSKTQWGDDDYPVYAEYNTKGELLCLTIRFDEQDDDDVPPPD